MSQNSKSKVFITGLPRTGTSSLCLALLEQGLLVAHNAFTEQSFYQAQVIADTPVFSDYPALAQRFPGSKFIHLKRELPDWLPSIEALLIKLNLQLENNPEQLHPLIKRSFEKVFGTLKPQWTENELKQAYLQHSKQIDQFFRVLNENQHISLELLQNKAESIKQLTNFLGLESGHIDLPHLNQQGKINDWAKLDHPGKVSSHMKDKAGRRKMLQCLSRDL